MSDKITRVTPERRREIVTIRLPRELIDWLDAQGSRTAVIEAALLQRKESTRAADPVPV